MLGAPAERGVGRREGGGGAWGPGFTSCWSPKMLFLRELSALCQNMHMIGW